MRRVHLALLVPLAGLWLGLAPHASESFVLETGSRFWIEGATSMNRFTCEAPQAAGHATVGETAETIEAVVAVPVRAFDCGRRRMNSDLYAALKGQQHPAIRFTLHRAEVLGAPSSSDWVPVRAWGTLSLAGTERPLTLDAKGRRLAEGRAEIRGVHALRMTDFDIDPPRGPLGLVRAHDDITVRFDLVATATG